VRASGAEKSSQGKGEPAWMTDPRKWSFLILYVLLAAGNLRAELPGPPPPWVPEGYTFLPYEETFRMSRAGGEEGKRLGQINLRNQALLEAALAKMSAAELEALQTKLRDYYKEAQAQEWKNFAMAAGARAAEHLRLLRSRGPSRFDAILQDQETGTSGFPDDADAVSREAERIEQLIGKQPNSDLYLAVLKPLRARPWNDDARHALHKIVKQDQPEFPADRGKVLTLQLAALEFVRRRELEQPDQGAWYSLEATLRDLPEQPGGAYWSREAAEQARDARFRPLRALWERAIALQARDNETHAMAVILARLDGDAEKEGEAMAWCARDGLERAAIEYNVRLVGDWYLTPGLRERLYKLTLTKPGGDTDWTGRLETLQTSPNYDLVISETSAILELPGTAPAIQSVPSAGSPSRATRGCPRSRPQGRR